MCKHNQLGRHAHGPSYSLILSAVALYFSPSSQRLDIRSLKIIVLRQQLWTLKRLEDLTRTIGKSMYCAPMSNPTGMRPAGVATTCAIVLYTS